MSVSSKAGPLRVDGSILRDGHGREIILRGVNLGGDSKLPWPDGACHVPTDFSDHRDVSFVGRPFPLEEADEHLARIAGWGFNCLRLLTTWEAVEHAGPGIYDQAYLDYFEAVAERAGAHGLHVFVDFHQDAWSRMSGGCGAPGWTFEAVGLDFTRFAAADAAIVMQAAMDYADPNPHQAAYPQMIWSSNYLGPANGLMWTLFWLGRALMPDFKVDGQNVQDFLQGRYIGAVDQVARRLARLPNVVGFDTFNEPGVGWAGSALTHRNLPGDSAPPRPLKPGPAWSPLDGLAAAQGVPVTLPVLSRDPETLGLFVSGERLCNPDGVRIWRPGVRCPFEAAGLYRLADGVATPLRPDAFTRPGGKPLSLADDLYAPFFGAVARTVRRYRPDWVMFAEMDAYALFQGRDFPERMPAASLNASHWYDASMLYTKAASREPYAERVARYRAQLGGIRKAAETFGGPTLIGEFGIPYDLDHGAAYRAWAGGDRDPDLWRDHEEALAAMYDVMDDLLLHATQWNYTASNRNDAWIGDGWNQEDLSIYSPDQVDDPANPDSGARGRRGFDRPYVKTAQGRLLRVRYDRGGGRFSATIDIDHAVAAPTEVHLPGWLYGEGVEVAVSDPSATVEVSGETRTLTVTAGRSGPLALTLTTA